MIFYYLFAAVILLSQAMILIAAWRNLVYTIRKYRPKETKYHPPAAVIIPCKGIDTAFDRNIGALFCQDYPHYEVFFVVESTADPAYRRLQSIMQDRRAAGDTVAARIIIAGVAENRGQKVHNLLAAVDALPEHVEVLAFVDSDACAQPYFLASLVYPLRRAGVGAATGHRWFVPADRRMASKVLSAINAFFASCLGPHRWNSAWGGAMALRREVFEQTDIARLWQGSCTDDYTLTRAMRDADLEIVFVPACFVASYERTTWRELFSFARRQFIITRVCMPGLYRLALLGIGHTLAGFWVGLCVTLTLWARGSSQAPYAAVLPVAVMLCHVAKASARQIMIRKILTRDRRRLWAPGLIDIFLGPVIHLFTYGCLVAAATTRSITWRGIRYTLHTIDRTEVHRLDRADSGGESSGCIP